MTTKRDSKRKQDERKSAKRPPKLKKEKLTDLDPKDKGEGVQGGFRSCGCYV